MSESIESFTLRLRAPAKINLVLRVGPVDRSGYHPLASWFCTVGLYDTVSMSLDDAGGSGDGIRVECDDPSLPTDARNLVVRAAFLLCGRAGFDPARLRMTLNKRIPSAAGLGGGSSDAASALIGINRHLSLGLDRATLAGLAAELGADVPFFVASARSAWCTGRGETVRPMPAPDRAKTALLVMPRGIALSTAEVYRRFDEMRLGRVENLIAVPDVAKLAALGSRDLLPALVNDLEPAAFSMSAELSRLRDALEQALGRGVRMSGSGSTLFSLFDSDCDGPGAGMDQPELAEAVATAGKVVAPSAAQVVLAPVAPRTGPEFSEERLRNLSTEESDRET